MCKKSMAIVFTLCLLALVLFNCTLFFIGNLWVGIAALAAYANNGNLSASESTAIGIVGALEATKWGTIAAFCGASSLVSGGISLAVGL
jgi:type IV secretory pathway TrbL component